MALERIKLSTSIPVVDSHTHVETYRHIEELKQAMDICGFEAMNILSLPGLDKLEKSFTLQNLIHILFKLMYPGKIYAYASLYHFMHDSAGGSFDFAKQAERLIAMGFDGFKMIEGKPTVRKSTGIPLNSDMYEGYFSYLEKNQIPLTFHVADPETFWDPLLVEEWAKASGWFYGDGTFPGKEDLYKEVDGILARHPGLKATFAHFYFLSADIVRAGRFLDKWPNVYFDVTPGTELYVNFGKKQREWHDFFSMYQNRIVFGTDNLTGFDKINPGPEGRIAKMHFMKTFFETYDETIEFYWAKARGICLDESILRKLYAENFRSIAGQTPAAVDKDLVLKECDRVIDWAKKQSDGGVMLEDAIEIKNRILPL